MMLKAIVKSNAMRAAASWLVTQYVRLAWATGRWRVEGSREHEALWDAGKPFILAFWHGRILMMPKCWRRGVTIHMLISRHRDGELITRAVRPFGIGTIRGSAAKPGSGKDKGGSAALREILKSLKTGQCIGITPDGPRGPRMRATDGVVSIARLAGVPVIPTAWSARGRWAMNSWDRFLIPKPFTHGVIVWGAPIHVPRDAEGVALEAYRLQIETAMNALTLEADRLAGAPSIEPAPAPPAEVAA
jgi:lysophospholipid acyltransferase (LPLAT)-like uncharacterized protein